MNEKERKNFLEEMIERVKEEILEKNSKMPDNWDGVELRWYIKECFSNVAWIDVSDRRKKRYRDYINHRNTNSI